MNDKEWRDATRQAFGYRLCGLAMDEVDEQGKPIADDTLLILFNGGAEKVQFVLPDAHPGNSWEVLIDTARGAESGNRFDVGSDLGLTERSMMLLRACRKGT